MIPFLANHPAQRRVASATIVAVGDESPRNPRITANANALRSSATERAARDLVTPLRGLPVFPSCPWVPSLCSVTHGYYCFGATRLFADWTSVSDLHMEYFTKNRSRIAKATGDRRLANDRSRRREEAGTLLPWRMRLKARSARLLPSAATDKSASSTSGYTPTGTTLHIV